MESRDLYPGRKLFFKKFEGALCVQGLKVVLLPLRDSFQPEKLHKEVRQEIMYCFRIGTL